MGTEIAVDAENTMAHAEGTLRDGVAERLHQQAPVAVAVCGEPVVARALALVLRGPRYDTRFVPTSSLNEVAPLEGVRLVLLAPTPSLSAERREDLLAELGEATAVARIPMLELVALSERVESTHAQMFWPCSAEQLERGIEAVLLAKRSGEDRREDSRTNSPRERRSA